MPQGASPPPTTLGSPVDRSTRVSVRSPAFRRPASSVSRRTWCVTQAKPSARTTMSGASPRCTTLVGFSVSGSMRTRLFGSTSGGASPPAILKPARTIAAATSAAAPIATNRRRRGRVGLAGLRRCEGGSSCASCLRMAASSSRNLRPGSSPSSVASSLRASIRFERLRLAARPVEREHQLGTQALAERMRTHEAVELGDELRVAAADEVGVDPLFERRHAQLRQSRDLGLRERLERDIRERRPAPQPERFREHSRRALGVARAKEIAAFAEQALGVVVCGVVAGVAVATPGLLVTATTPIRGTIAKPVKVGVEGLVRLKTKGPMEVVDQVLTLQPGGHT